MPLRRTKHLALSAAVQDQTAELRQTRCALFIQQFEKEAQERVSEMEAKMDNMLATVCKFFKVERMKMPPSLQNTLMADLISGKPNNSPEIHQPLKRVSSRKGEAVGGKGTKKTRALVGSNSTGNLGASTCTVKRTTSRLLKNGDLTAKTKPKFRSVSSAGDLCSVAGCGPHVTITTSRGQTFCVSEETKDDINLDMLDDVALFQMQKLMVMDRSPFFPCIPV
ncbi:Borealin-2 [Merluccius polli]|uniref:Borealin-2 n=1 Tax=Merluccius polli TaxID=89951 RepID=A0AA47P5W2_MERPO|nr:Borealin-2 [Merluccius polli]